MIALLAACDPTPMTMAEVLAALEETHSSARGEELVSEPIEVDTDFTIGAALEDAAEELRAWWAAVAPCAEVTVTGATVVVDFGELGDDCVYDGHTWAGVAEATVVATTPGALEVHHTWTGLGDEEIAVDGGATVTWSGTDLTRNVVTEHTWSERDGTASVDVTGDHTEGLLDDSAGLLGGIWMAGTRDWTSDSGTWALDMADLEIRWIDPVPQAGSVVITSPAGKTLTVTYTRLDANTIRLDVVGARRDLVFHVNALGIVETVE
jgi:hypothetical protein